MIQIIDGDLFETNCDVIIHQVNCQGVMGSGVAKIVKDRYPNVFEVYKELCNDYSPEYLLGKICVVTGDDHKDIVNMFSQNNFGYKGQFTDYEAMRSCFKKISLLHSQ